MAQLDQLMNKFILVIIVVLGLFLFVQDVQDKNNAPQPLSENVLFSSTVDSISSNLDTQNDLVGTQYNSFINENPPEGLISIVLKTIVSFGKTVGGYVNIIISLLFRLPLIVLGIPANLANLISTWLLIILVISLWILYKLGG